MLSNFGTTNVNANADPTGKGMTIGQDYLAGTDPNNVNSVLRITAESFASGGTSAMLTWNSVPTRFYYMQKTPTLTTRLVGQRLGTGFAFGRFHHGSRFRRHQRADAVLSRRGSSSAYAVNAVKVLWPDKGSCQLRQNSDLTLSATGRPASA